MVRTVAALLMPLPGMDSSLRPPRAEALVVIHISSDLGMISAVQWQDRASDFFRAVGPRYSSPRQVLAAVGYVPSRNRKSCKHAPSTMSYRAIRWQHQIAGPWRVPSGLADPTEFVTHGSVRLRRGLLWRGPTALKNSHATEMQYNTYVEQRGLGLRFTHFFGHPWPCARGAMTDRPVRIPMFYRLFFATIGLVPMER